MQAWSTGNGVVAASAAAADAAPAAAAAAAAAAASVPDPAAAPGLHFCSFFHSVIYFKVIAAATVRVRTRLVLYVLPLPVFMGKCYFLQSHPFY